MSSGSRGGNKHNSLLAIVLDVSPSAWGEREIRRSANDKNRQAQNKRSIGPATLEELLRAVQAFATAFGSLERQSALFIVAVADNETAVVFPRKHHWQDYFGNPEARSSYDLRTLPADLVQGVSELLTRAANKTNTAHKDMQQENCNGSVAAASVVSSAAMASAFSLALCCINRFLVATQTGVGVSAVRPEHLLHRSSDESGGVLAGLLGEVDKRKAQRANAWSPRILLVQASEDRARDYNAFMNGAFSAVKHNIVVDGCFIPSGAPQPTTPSSSGKPTSSSADAHTTSSAFLEQACDLTGGVFLTPSGAAQVGGALTEVLMSVFLAPRTCRWQLQLPAINKVDFRARCFETGDIVDMAFVCNQCLSIFKNKPQHTCPTCQATIHSDDP